jgi:hypothetical protein
VIPLVIGQIGRLLPALLGDDRDDDARLLCALGHVAVPGGAVGVVGPPAGGERLGVGATGLTIFAAAELF